MINLAEVYARSFDPAELTKITFNLACLQNEFYPKLNYLQGDFYPNLIVY